MKNNKTYDIRITFLSLVFPIGVFLPFLLPTSISNIIKPLFIIVSLFVVQSKKKSLVNKYNTWLIVFALLYLIATIRSVFESGFFQGISILLYIIFALLIVAVNFNEKELNGIIFLLFITGILFSIGIAFFNPFFGTNWMNRTRLNVFFSTMNSNQCVYPSLVALSTIPLVVRSRNKILRFASLLAFFLHTYVVFLTISRSGFLCWICICLYSLIYYFFKSNIRYKNALFILTLVLIIGSGYLLLSILPKDTMKRLFTIDSYINSSGRLEMLLYGIKSTKNVIFGDGVGVWRMLGNDTKMHNLFVNTYMETGLIGLLLLIIVFLFPLFKTIKTPYFVFYFPALFQSLFESGDAYTFWIPLSILYICYAIEAGKTSIIRKKERSIAINAPSY